MKIQISFFFITLLSSYCYGTENKEQFYSTSFLKDYKAVQKSLHDEGFKKVTITTADNLKLSGLYLNRPNAQYNVIVCAGWLPGRKEGMATFYALLPECCNILFFDARGHGESEGSLLWKLWRYGIDEYKDITAAVSWCTNNNRLPIIIAGICSGAFNAMHAVNYIEKNNPYHNVKGLIFDSGWGSIIKIIKTSPIAGIKKRLSCCISYFYKKKSRLNNYLYRACSFSMKHLCTLCNHLCAEPLTIQYDHITNLFNIMETITTPVLFIHSYDDVYADIQDAINLSHLVKNKQCWWIEKSSHAKHHLIHKTLYKEKIITFIDTVINEGGITNQPKTL